jgi:8-oxo-(d)GTP phosphatase
MSPSEASVIAGGCVCWKVVDGEVRVLVVHRTQHKDVSLPKGKRDPGETVPETAQREILEETGLHVSLGAYLGRVDYLLPSKKPKEVHYWAAEVDPGEAERSPFESNDEIFALEWLPLKKAQKRLSYEHDADILENFQSLYDSGRAKTFPLIVVRHAKAMPPENWDGPDHTRPLLHKGLTQALNIAPGINAYKPSVIVASTAARCVATLEPLVAISGLELKTSKSISQDAYQAGGKKAFQAVSKRVINRQGAVLCSHGPVVPQLVAAANEIGGGSGHALSKAANLSVASFSVIHFSSETDTPHIVAVETHQAPQDSRDS